MENSKITKQNGNVVFEEEDHVYYDKDDPKKKYTSVTTLIHSFTQPFDSQFWSAYKAMEKLLPKDEWAIEKKSLLANKKFDKSLLELHNISEDDFNREQQALLDEWDEENRRSCERGTKIHAELENSFYTKRKDIDLSKYQIGGKFECVKNHTALDLENGVYPEYLISRVSDDGKLRIAGQIDLLVKKGNHITIGDWKGLALDTEIPTVKEGWTTLDRIKEGDMIFDKNGAPTKVLHKSEIHYNPCYKITFDTGETIVADHEHRWLIEIEGKEVVKTTEELTKESFPKIKMCKPLEILYYPVGYFIIDNYLKDHPDIEYYEYTARNPQELAVVEFNIALFGIKFWVKGMTVGFYVEDYNLARSRKSEEINPERQYRTIISIESVETVATQCLEVDSYTHTFLCTRHCIVTHNTNKKIETKGFFDSKTKSTTKMKFPLNNLDDVNYSHYCLQLSTYAWMMQKLNPEYVIDDLVLVHFDHNDNMTVYHLPYLKDEVIKMLSFYKKESILAENKKKRQRYEY